MAPTPSTIRRLPAPKPDSASGQFAEGGGGPLPDRSAWRRCYRIALHPEWCTRQWRSMRAKASSDFSLFHPECGRRARQLSPTRPSEATIPPCCAPYKDFFIMKLERAQPSPELGTVRPPRVAAPPIQRKDGRHAEPLQADDPASVRSRLVDAQRVH